MTKYNSEYYIALKAVPNMEYVGFSPDDATSQRRFNVERPRQGSAPFFFKNQSREKDKKKGVIRKISDVFARSSLGWLINDDARGKLKGFKVDGVVFHPAIYIDDADNWHENYWYVGFYERLDCYSREKSKLLGDPSKPLSVTILKYHLDESILDALPEERRLMFMMGGDGSNDIFVHQKIVDIFRMNKYSGVRFIKVSEYELEMQFMDEHPSFIQF